MNTPKKILIVDDSPDICRTWKAVLTEKGYLVDTIDYGYLAFVKMDNKDYDLVFMDMKLKGQDGVKTYKDIKDIKPDVKVVIMTGYSKEEIGDLIEEGVEQGMIDEYLRKPVDPEELIKVIEKHTNRDEAKR